VIVFGVLALSAGDLTLGGLLVFFTYLAQLYSPIRSLGSLANEVFAAAAGAERVLELLNEPPAVRDRPAARPLPAPVRGRVELRDVVYAHPAGDRPALRNVSFTVRPGEIVALVGPSGAGKSTLARLLVRFDDPQGGAVLVDGHDLRDVTVASVREQVGLLLQDTFVLDTTVREAIAMGRAGATGEAILAAARSAGIHDVIARLPDGYETRLGAGGGRLSGGERRRLAIARAYVRDSPVLVLDEPTTGLDTDARDALLEPLRELVRGRTTILISHDPAVVGWADRVLELHDGVLASPQVVTP
jgi:ATP-binding cassette subfamily B protein